MEKFPIHFCLVYLCRLTFNTKEIDYIFLYTTFIHCAAKLT
jgi:hypothetical protein